MFTTESMPRVLQALELPAAKFVIRFLPSNEGVDEYRAHTEYAGTHNEFACEVDTDDADVIEQQLCLFMKECILPIAMKTNAVIFTCGMEDCSLACAAERVLGPIQRQLGKSCPFTIVGFVDEYECHFAARNPRTIAGQIRECSKVWSQKFDVEEQVWESQWGKSGFQQGDLTEGPSHYIVFECIRPDSLSNGTLDSGPGQMFKNMLLESLASVLPNIAVQTYSAGLGLAGMADIVRRDLPLLVLDSRERWPTLESTTEPIQYTTHLAQSSQSKPGAITGDLISEAYDCFSRHTEALMQESKLERYNACTIAFLHAVLRKFDMDCYNVDHLRLHEALQEARDRADMHAVGSHNVVHQDVANELCTFYFQRCQVDSKRLDKCYLEDWIKRQEPATNERLG